MKQPIMDLPGTRHFRERTLLYGVLYVDLIPNFLLHTMATGAGQESNAMAKHFILQFQTTSRHEPDNARDEPSLLHQG